MLDVDWNSTFHSFIKSLQYSPLQSVPLFTGCRNKKGLAGEPLMEGVYVSALLVLTVPMAFILIAMVACRLVFHNAVKAGLCSDLVLKTLRDIYIKSMVWFSLFSFPILSAR